MLHLRVYIRVPSDSGRLGTQIVEATLRSATRVSSYPDGIRVEDLLDAVAKISAYAEEMLWEWDETAWYATENGDGRWEVVEPAQGQSKIEVRREMSP